MSVISVVENQYKKAHLTDVKSGDTVRVHQKIREGSKERIQIFEGLVMRTKRSNSHTASITVRRVASGVGVEKTYLMHSPLITKIEVMKRSKVRRNYLSYMRTRTGKSARLTGVDFDKAAVNETPKDKQAPEADGPKPQAESKPTAEETDKLEAEGKDKIDAKSAENLADRASEQKSGEKAEAENKPAENRES